MKVQPKAVVLGAGAFGTAIALALERTGKCEVLILPKFACEKKELSEKRQNEAWLPGISVPENILVGPCFDDIAESREVFNEANIVFWVIPSKFSFETAEKLKSIIPVHYPIMICSKGLIEKDNEILVISQVLAKFLSNPLGVLSGPNFAREIALNLFSASVITSLDKKIANYAANLIKSENFQVCIRDDIMSAQIFGAIKNVLAIACGIVSGAESFGQNTKAAVITQGIQELAILSEKYGGSKDMILSLCGIGDIFLTCFSEQSRNTRFGIALGQGESIENLLSTQKQAVEGYFTAKPVYDLLHKFSLKSPILEAIYHILYEKYPSIETIKQSLKFS
ncbi:MAG: NAD(P)H-dependent glycerol-3-phosphate dehydrogenase [Holosporales bacterium]|jgi:glycerol-3-phosphate dehydrogenase (NAD(P)+)|nr:NAD(P)H-dependent glycerol-3-phosphate dehydrogenase [Holosporales bacterium]